uniref:DUF4470 domain-containing protein n=1 Tax=Heterorhabditis bacteriophora TaxID=37862 RepID=A0A1I7WH20_HETBA
MCLNRINAAILNDITSAETMIATLLSGVILTGRSPINFLMGSEHVSVHPVVQKKVPLTGDRVAGFVKCLGMFSKIMFSIKSISIFHYVSHISFLLMYYFSYHWRISSPLLNQLIEGQMFQVFVASRGLPYRECDIFDDVVCTSVINDEDLNPAQTLEHITKISLILFNNEKQEHILSTTLVSTKKLPMSLSNGCYQTQKNELDMKRVLTACLDAIFENRLSEARKEVVEALESGSRSERDLMSKLVKVELRSPVHPISVVICETYGLLLS